MNENSLIKSRLASPINSAFKGKPNIFMYPIGYPLNRTGLNFANDLLRILAIS